MATGRDMLVALVVTAMLTSVGCTGKTVTPDGYKPGVTPGTSVSTVERILGKPTERSPFALGNIHADVLTYPFGQVLVQNGRISAVTIAQDPQFVGPAGIRLGMQEEQVRRDLLAQHRRRTGHKDSYDLVVGQTDTRTRDIYDETDHIIIEMAAANANDPMAPFSVIGITLADSAGMATMSAITQAKVSGAYPDQHVDNFVSDPWQT